MKNLTEYILESQNLPTFYFGTKGENLTINNGKIRFIYTENLDNTFSEHRPTKRGNSLILRKNNGAYVIITPQKDKQTIHDVIKQVFHGAKKVDSIETQISSVYPHRGMTGEQPQISIKVEVYEVNPEDVNWIKFDKLSSNLWIEVSKSPYGIVGLDRQYVWDKFK